MFIKFNRGFPGGRTRLSDFTFPGGSVTKNPAANAGDTGSIPDPGGSNLGATKPVCHNF